MVKNGRARDHLYNVLGVRHILNAANDVRGADGDKRFQILRVNAMDVVGFNVFPAFKQSSNFIEQAIDHDRPVYVHCAEGISRSVTLVLAYMMAKRKMTLSDSFDMVKKVRMFAQVKMGFWQQLMKLEHRVHGAVSCDIRKYIVHKLGYTAAIADRLMKDIKPLHIETKKSTTTSKKSATAATATTEEFSLKKAKNKAAKKEKTCEKFWASGTCKYGDKCRFLHDETESLLRLDLHLHVIGPDDARKRKKNKCNLCSKRTKLTGFRCQTGCDWDVCADCMG